MQKEIDINNQKLKIVSKNSQIEFILDDNILFSGIPFNDVYCYDDVELKDNKILLTAKIQKITRTRDSVVKQLVPVVREFDTSLFKYPKSQEKPQEENNSETNENETLESEE